VQAALEPGTKAPGESGRASACTWVTASPTHADFYDIRHVLILGRVTSGSGGGLNPERAKAVLESEFPDVAARASIQLRTRRAGA